MALFSACCSGNSRSTVGEKDVDYLHPFHDRSSPLYLKPRYWGVNREDINHFKAEVKEYLKMGHFSRPEGTRPSNLAVSGSEEIDPVLGPQIYGVNEVYIKPVTRDEGTSWAIMRHNEGLHCDCFASHGWAEGAFEFIRKLRQAWPMRAIGIYICFLANPQNGNVSKMLGDDITHSPFYEALLTSKYMLVISNSKMSIYSRLWCVFEASEAIELARKGELHMTLPWYPKKRYVCCHSTVAGLLITSGLYMGSFILFEIVGVLFGPIMWLVIAFMSCYITSWILRLVFNSLHYHDLMRSRTVYLGMIVVEYVELFVIGTAAGLAFKWLTPGDPDHWLYDIFDWEPFALKPLNVTGKAAYHFKYNWMNDFFHIGHNIRFAKGEGLSCLQVLVSLTLISIYKIVLIMIRYIVYVNREDLQHGFSSIREARATNPIDEQNIRQRIAGREDDIDMSLQELVQIGRCNRGVLQNLSLGMGLETVADGIHPFKIMCGTYAWLFWFSTDYAGMEEWCWAALVPIVAMVPIYAICYGILGDHSIFAVDAYVWFGIVFVFFSNHTTVFTKNGALKHDMRIASAPLAGLCLALMMLTNAYHYSGCRARVTSWMVSAGFGAIMVNRPPAMPLPPRAELGHAHPNAYVSLKKVSKEHA